MSRLALLASLLVLVASACSEPQVVPIIGPDGSRMLHLSCGNQEGECYRLAGEHCPYGYDLGRTMAGHGNMLVRCREPGEPSRATTYPAYRASTTSPAPTYAVSAAAPAPSASVTCQSVAAAPPAGPAPANSVSVSPSLDGFR